MAQMRIIRRMPPTSSEVKIIAAMAFNISFAPSSLSMTARAAIHGATSAHEPPVAPHVGILGNGEGRGNGPAARWHVARRVRPWLEASLQSDCKVRGTPSGVAGRRFIRDKRENGRDIGRIIPWA